ncbi:MAG: hypothetical protein WAT43_13850 [Chitinophagales bacterium]|nr:hypothetical protein [Bacteroidota bacterium]
MNTKKHIAELHPEVKAWMSYVAYVKDELKVFNLRLEEIISKNTGKEVMAHTEHFQNQFIRQNEACDELMHDLHRVEKSYSDLAVNNPAAMHVAVADEVGLRDRVDTHRHIFEDLTHEFRAFLSKYM